MKVIEEGSRTVKAWTEEIECKECESQLEIDASDVKMGIFGGNYREEGSPGLYVTCVVCGENTLLGEAGVDVPKAVEKKAREAFEKRR